jgi:hypothetical protein
METDEGKLDVMRRSQKMGAKKNRLHSSSRALWN